MIQLLLWEKYSIRLLLQLVGNSADAILHIKGDFIELHLVQVPFLLKNNRVNIIASVVKCLFRRVGKK